MTIIPVDFRSPLRKFAPLSANAVQSCDAIAMRDECIVLVRFMNAEFVKAPAAHSYERRVPRMPAARNGGTGRHTDRLPPPAAWPPFSRTSCMRRRWERMRLTAAAVLLSAAEWLLTLTLRFVRAGLIGRIGIRRMMRISARLRRLSWTLWR